MDINSSPFAQQWLRHARGVTQAYSVRISLGLIASLLLVLGATRIPVHESSVFVGWGRAASGERIELRDLAESNQNTEESLVQSDAPVTAHTSQRSEPTNDLRPAEEEDDEIVMPADAEEEPAVRHAVELTALGPAGQRPQVLGGRGSLYLRIDYPEEARRNGIEGRVLLEFIIDTEGFTRDIRVIQSLHPLCDSSAVAALKQTRFVPGRRNDETIPVRMRLPVRFQLLNFTVNNTESSPSNH